MTSVRRDINSPVTGFSQPESRVHPADPFCRRSLRFLHLRRAGFLQRRTFSRIRSGLKRHRLRCINNRYERGLAPISLGASRLHNH